MTCWSSDVRVGVLTSDTLDCLEPMHRSHHWLGTTPTPSAPFTFSHINMIFMVVFRTSTWFRIIYLKFNNNMIQRMA